MTKVSSISAVRLGPVIKVMALPREASIDGSAKQENRSSREERIFSLGRRQMWIVGAKETHRPPDWAENRTRVPVSARA
jgi:hypothetical protein